MWVMCADSKALCFVKKFKIEKEYGGKDKKYALVGFINIEHEVNPTVICAYFQDEDKAVDALEKVCQFLEETPQKVYRFDKLYK